MPNYQLETPHVMLSSFLNLCFSEPFCRFNIEQNHWDWVSNCIELLNFGVENGNAIPDLSLLFDYYMNFPEQMQFIGLDVIHYLRFVVDVLFAQTVRDNYFPGYDIQKIHHQFIDFKNNNGPNLMICKSDFARGRVTALQNYWKEIDWKYYSIYQLNYDFVGITEFEAAFWWKLLQRHSWIIRMRLLLQRLRMKREFF